MSPVLLLLLALQAEPDLDQEFDQAALVVVASEFACHKLDVYLAETFEQRRQGLMFVRRLPAMSGMLFLYDRPEFVSMWMKNTVLSLDIIYIGADGNIVNVAAHTEPKSLRSIPSDGPAQYVLELNAGAAERLRLDSDSRVLVNDLIEFRP